MKKSIIAAGAASAVLAAMPVVGVFAATTTVDDNSVTDNLEITNNVSCTISQASHAAGATATGLTSSWADATHTLSATINTGVAYSDIGSTTFKVVCNDTQGWGVNVAGSGTDGALTLKGADNSTTIAAASALTNETTSAWTFAASTLTGDGTPGTAGTTPIYTSADEAIATAGDTFKVTYGARINSDVKAQKYTGSVTYTLYHNVTE